MIQEQATVVEVEGERAWVETVRQASCGGCGSQSSCGTSALAKLFGNRPFRVEVHNPLQAAVGDRVTIAVTEEGVMGGAARLYLFPLMALFLSLGGISLLFVAWAEWQQILLSLGVTLLLVQWMRNQGWFSVKNLTPEITQVHRQAINLIQ